MDACKDYCKDHKASPPPDCYTPPQVGWLEHNFDGLFDYDKTDKAGIDGIIRDHQERGINH